MNDEATTARPHTRVEEVPVPPALQRFPLWHGYPVHYTVWRDKSGRPDFRIMDDARRWECFRKQWCHLCGRNLGQGPYCFIGGPKSVEAHRFVDGPMHRECAEYAARVCPFLASPTGKYRTVVYAEIDGQVVEYESVDNIRPPKMALVVAESYHMERNPGRRRDSPSRPAGIYINPPPLEPHAVNPEGAAQMVCVVGNYVEVDWNLMPQSVEQEHPQDNKVEQEQNDG